MDRLKNIWLLVLITFFSCESLIDEEFYGPSNVPLINRVNGTYVILKDWYGKELGYDLSEAGTDLFTWGQEHKLKEMMTYEPEFDAENPRLCILWSDLYKGLESCNSTLKYIKETEAGISKKELAVMASEVRFLRAHYLWIIAETWGGVHFTTQSTTGPEFEANVTPIAVFYEQIISDLTYAVNNLSPNDNQQEADYGRVTKLAAIAFRARMYLMMGAYTQALNDADSAIMLSAQYGMHLAPDYGDLWLVENSEDNPEIIWSLNYSTTLYSTMNIAQEDVLTFCNTNTGIYSTETYDGKDNIPNGGGGFWGQLYFTMSYDDIPGLKRESYNRPYRRYIPTLFFLDLFDDLDERFEATFRTVFYSNDDAEIPKWPALDHNNNTFVPEGKKIGDPIFEPSAIPFKGDTAILLTNKEIGKEMLVTIKDMAIHKKGHYIVLDRNMLYDTDNTPVTNKVKVNGINLNRQIYLGLKKFSDPTLESGRYVVGSTRSGRDAAIIRLAEIYLIASEASFRTGTQGHLGNALAYLRVLYDNRAKNGDGQALMKAYEINTVDDLSNIFYLKERARELAAEQLRWFDLKRMHRNDDGFDMVDWIKSNNPDAGLMKDYHVNRPIPQMQINAMKNPGLYYQLNEPYTTGGNTKEK
jgi:starch-binding outer membrane protein, SusD/RagB family